MSGSCEGRREAILLFVLMFGLLTACAVLSFSKKKKRKKKKGPSYFDYYMMARALASVFSFFFFAILGLRQREEKL